MARCNYLKVNEITFKWFTLKLFNEYIKNINILASLQLVLSRVSMYIIIGQTVAFLVLWDLFWLFQGLKGTVKKSRLFSGSKLVFGKLLLICCFTSTANI